MLFGDYARLRTASRNVDTPQTLPYEALQHLPCDPYLAPCVCPSLYFSERSTTRTKVPVSLEADVSGAFVARSSAEKKKSKCDRKNRKDCCQMDKLH